MSEGRTASILVDPSFFTIPFFMRALRFAKHRVLGYHGEQLKKFCSAKIVFLDKLDNLLSAAPKALTVGRPATFNVGRWATSLFFMRA